MAILKVAMMGNPVLRKKAAAVKDPTVPEIQRLIDDLIETMHEYAGVGLAAPQVHVSLRVCIVEPAKSQGPIALVNPVIEPLSQQKAEDWEGCLSINDMRGMVPRFRHVAVKALDRQGKELKFEATEFAARVVQHEVDHLEGVLYLDRMKDFGSLSHMSEWSRYGLKK